MYPKSQNCKIDNFSVIANEKNEDLEVDFVIEDKSELESYYIWEIVNIDPNGDGGQTENTNPLSQTWIDDLTNNPNHLITGQREILENNSFGDGTYTGTYSSLGRNRRISKGVGSGETELYNYAHETAALDKDPNDTNPDFISQTGVSDDNSSGGEEADKVIHKYELRVMSISKELYDFYSSVEENYRNKDNNHSNQVIKPTYTNVSGGLGIFAGFSESVLQF